MTSFPLSRASNVDLLKAQLRTLLQERRMDLRLPTEKDLAVLLQTSIPTLRKALLSLAQDEWLINDESKGWKVTAKARKPRIALLYDLDISRVAIATAHLHRIQRSKQLLEEHGYDVTLYLGDTLHSPDAPPQLSCRQFIKDHREGLFSGVLCLWGYLGDEWTRSLREAGVPVVGLARFFENMVTYDSLAYVRKALDLLKQRGRKRVAWLGGIAQWNIGGRDQEYRNNVLRLIQESGDFVTYEEWVRQEWHHSVVAGQWSAFRELWTQRRERPDALILHNTGSWLEVQNALESFHLTPGRELDITLASERVPRDTAPLVGTHLFQFDSEQMLQRAVLLLHELLNGVTPSSSRQFVDAWFPPLFISPDSPEERTPLHESRLSADSQLFALPQL